MLLTWSLNMWCNMGGSNTGKISQSMAAGSIVKPWWAAVVVVVEVLMLSAVNLQRVRVCKGDAPPSSAKHPGRAKLWAKDVVVSLLAVVPPMLQVRDCCLHVLVCVLLVTWLHGALSYDLPGSLLSGARMFEESMGDPQ